MGDGVPNSKDLLEPQQQFGETNKMWKQEMAERQSEVKKLQEKLLEVKSKIHCSEDNARELELLWWRVKTATTFLTHLKSKAKIMEVPHLAHVACGIKYQDGVGLTDKSGIPLSDWSDGVNPALFEVSNEEKLLVTRDAVGSLDSYDGPYVGEIVKSVNVVTNAVQSLAKRVIAAENEFAADKQKVRFSQEVIKKKELQIKSMSEKVEEMEKFALGTSSLLNEMHVKVKDMVEEASRQRQRAAENEQDLSRVKRDFESLKSYASTLSNVKEALLSSEKQFQTMEKLFERLMAKTTRLEEEKEQKEAEVQQLMAENVKLLILLDKKEAQLVAMNEQCKFMALNM